MSYRIYKIKKIGDLIHLLPKIYKNELVWFRGHSKHDWKLEPQLSRRNKLQNEKSLIRNFKINANLFLERNLTEDYEWLFLMQHYGVPTRLLDWTESPLIGLYFSIFDSNGKLGNPDSDGALWCLYPKKLNKHIVEDVLSFGESGDAAKTLEAYRPNLFNPNEKANQKPIAIIAPRQFQRVYAQQGVFTISHVKKTPIENIDDQKHVVKIIIPKDFKRTLKEELLNLKINFMSVFPELVNVGKLAKESL